MRFAKWLRRLFSRRDSSEETVPFLDVQRGRVVRIPASRLRPGLIQVRTMRSDELVWAVADQLRQGPVRHPPFGEDIREHIRRIQAAFAEHRPLSLEEWEEGFRRDITPKSEIALWLHAADVYHEFAGQEPSPERRKDVYRVIISCLTTSPHTVWQVLQLAVLTRLEAKPVVDRMFFGRRASPSAAPGRGPHSGLQ